VGKPTEVVRQAQRAYDAGDVEALSDLLAPDVVRVNNSAPAVVGRDAFLDVAAMQRRLFPDVMVERTHWVEEDEWVAFRFRATGTNSVEAPGLPATGRKVEFQGAAHVRVVDGKIAEQLEVSDEAGFFRQIGQLPDV